MFTRKIAAPIIATFSLAIMMACSSAQVPEPAPGASQGNEAVPAEHQEAKWGATLSDGQILEVLSAVDRAEIEQAQVALTKSQSPRVREFAQHMVDQHGASLREGEQVATSSSLTPSDSAASLDLKPKAAEVLQTLNSSDPASFDHAYMMSQIQQHEEVLKLLSDQMLPAASAPAVRQLATKAHAMVQHHLEQARTIQP